MLIEKRIFLTKMDCVDLQIKLKRENVIKKSKPENNYFVIYIASDIPFTGILFHINCTLVHDSLSRSNYVSNLTFSSDFDTFLIIRDFFFLQAQLVDEECVLTRIIL